MFHHSTTLHHSHHSHSGFTGREARVLHLNKFAEWGMKTRAVASYFSPLKRAAKLYSWAFGWPLIVKGADLSMKGLEKGLDGTQWAGHAGVEAAKASYEMTAKPFVVIPAWASLVAIKRFLVDLPIATFSAAIRTPIALATSPLHMVSGVRSAISSIPKSYEALKNSISQFRIGEIMGNTRRAITDVLLPPVTIPGKAVLGPVYNMVNTALGAKLQILSRMREAVTEVIPGGWNRMKNAGNVASMKLAVNQQARFARRAEKAAEKQQRQEAIDAYIAESRGLTPPANAQKKAA